MCGCPRDKLCDLCCGGMFDNLRGTAACRGETWADQVARSVTRGRQWPAYGETVVAIARRKVEDLAHDERLLALLAADLAAWAARRWLRHAATTGLDDDLVRTMAT